MSFDRSCGRGSARLSLFLTLAVFAVPAAAQVLPNPGDAGGNGEVGRLRDHPAGARRVERDAPSRP